METALINYKSKFRHVYFQKYYQWIVQIFSMKAVILLNKICIAKIREITCPNKVLAELLCIKLQKIRFAGPYNVTIIWVK